MPAGATPFTLPYEAIPTPSPTWWVNCEYKTGGDGTSYGTAFARIQQALDNPLLKAGDVIQVVDGTCAESLNWDSAPDGLDDKPITLRGRTNEDPPTFIETQGSLPAVAVTKKNWIIDNFYVWGNSPNSGALVTVKGAGASNVLLRRLLVSKGAGGSGIYVGDGAHHVKLSSVSVGRIIRTKNPTQESCFDHTDCLPYDTLSGSPPDYKGLVCSEVLGFGSCAERDDGHGIFIAPNAHDVMVVNSSSSGNSGDGLQCGVGQDEMQAGQVQPANIYLEGFSSSRSSSQGANGENAVDIKYCTGVTVKDGYFSGFRPTRNNRGNSAQGEAIVLHKGASNVLVDNTRISNSCVGIGIGTELASEDPVNIVIRRNRFYAPAAKDTAHNPCTSRGIAISRVTNADIYNNTFDGFQGAAISAGELVVGAGVVNVDVWNNIFAGNASGYYIGVKDTGVSDFESGYNLYASSAAGRFRCNFNLVDFVGWRACSGGGISGPLDPVGQSLSGDPLFSTASDSLGLLYDLQGGSPALNKALTPAGSPGVCGTAWDLGARELCP